MNIDYSFTGLRSGDKEDRPTLVRTFPLELGQEGDGRTIEARIVPYGIPATVADPPDFIPYQEMFVQGALRGAAKAPNRVLLDFEHHTSIGNVLGHAIEIDERDDGAYAKLRVAEHADGDKALALIRDKVLTAMSVMFQPLGRSPVVDGIVQRVKVHLDRVSLCRVGAYQEAQVLAVRQAPIIDQQPIPFNPELANRIAKYVNIPVQLLASQEKS